MQVTPYLNFNGQCAEAFKFYAEALNGKIVMMATFGEAPPDAQCGPNMDDRIMHARLVAGDVVLMGSDCPPEYFQPAQGLWVSLHVESIAEAERLFHAFAEGGTVQMPIQETFWAARFAMVTDRFGTPWMINCEQAAVS